MLERYCFAWSGISELSLPASLEKIGTCAFLGCEKLKNVTIAPESRLGVVEANAFDNTQLEETDVEFPEGAQVAEDAFAKKG